MEKSTSNLALSSMPVIHGTKAKAISPEKVRETESVLSHLEDLIRTLESIDHSRSSVPFQYDNSLFLHQQMHSVYKGNRHIFRANRQIAQEIPPLNSSPSPPSLETTTNMVDVEDESLPGISGTTVPRLHFQVDQTEPIEPHNDEKMEIPEEDSEMRQKSSSLKRKPTSPRERTGKIIPSGESTHREELVSVSRTDIHYCVRYGLDTPDKLTDHILKPENKPEMFQSALDMLDRYVSVSMLLGLDAPSREHWEKIISAYPESQMDLNAYLKTRYEENSLFMIRSTPDPETGEKLTFKNSGDSFDFCEKHTINTLKDLLNYFQTHRLSWRKRMAVLNNYLRGAGAINREPIKPEDLRRLVVSAPRQYLKEFRQSEHSRVSHYPVSYDYFDMNPGFLQRVRETRMRSPSEALTGMLEKDSVENRQHLLLQLGRGCFASPEQAITREEARRFLTGNQKKTIYVKTYEKNYGKENYVSGKLLDETVVDYGFCTEKGVKDKESLKKFCTDLTAQDRWIVIENYLRGQGCFNREALTPKDIQELLGSETHHAEAYLKRCEEYLVSLDTRKSADKFTALKRLCEDKTPEQKIAIVLNYHFQFGITTDQLEELFKTEIAKASPESVTAWFYGQAKDYYESLQSPFVARLPYDYCERNGITTEQKLMEACEKLSDARDRWELLENYCIGQGCFERLTPADPLLNANALKKALKTSEIDLSKHWKSVKGFLEGTCTIEELNKATKLSPKELKDLLGKPYEPFFQLLSDYLIPDSQLKTILKGKEDQQDLTPYLDLAKRYLCGEASRQDVHQSGVDSNEFYTRINGLPQQITKKEMPQWQGGYKGRIDKRIQGKALKEKLGEFQNDWKQVAQYFSGNLSPERLRKEKPELAKALFDDHILGPGYNDLLLKAEAFYQSESYGTRLELVQSRKVFDDDFYQTTIGPQWKYYCRDFHNSKMLFPHDYCLQHGINSIQDLKRHCQFKLLPEVELIIDNYRFGTGHEARNAEENELNDDRAQSLLEDYMTGWISIKQDLQYFLRIIHVDYQQGKKTTSGRSGILARIAQMAETNGYVTEPILENRENLNEIRDRITWVMARLDGTYDLVEDPYLFYNTLRLGSSTPILMEDYVKTTAPLFNWIGNKGRLAGVIKHILENLAGNGKNQRLIEPFVGSGQTFLNVGKFDTHIMGDGNHLHINLYNAMKTDPEKFEAALKKLSERYEELSQPKEEESPQKKGEKPKTPKELLFEECLKKCTGFHSGFHATDIDVAAAYYFILNNNEKLQYDFDNSAIDPEKTRPKTGKTVNFGFRPKGEGKEEMDMAGPTKKIKIEEEEGNIESDTGNTPVKFERARQTFYERAEKGFFHHLDWRDTLGMVQSGDVVYLDPPYVGNFLRSNEEGTTGQTYASEDQGGFTRKDQIALARRSRELALGIFKKGDLPDPDKGASVVISNFATLDIMGIYSGTGCTKLYSLPYSRQKGARQFEAVAVYEPRNLSIRETEVWLDRVLTKFSAKNAGEKNGDYQEELKKAYEEFAKLIGTGKDKALLIRNFDHALNEIAREYNVVVKPEDLPDDPDITATESRLKIPQEILGPWKELRAFQVPMRTDLAGNVDLAKVKQVVTELSERLEKAKDVDFSVKIQIKYFLSELSKDMEFESVKQELKAMSFPDLQTLTEKYGKDTAELISPLNERFSSIGAMLIAGQKPDAKIIENQIQTLTEHLSKVEQIILELAGSSEKEPSESLKALHHSVEQCDRYLKFLGQLQNRINRAFSGWSTSYTSEPENAYPAHINAPPESNQLIRARGGGNCAFNSFALALVDIVNLARTNQLSEQAQQNLNIFICRLGLNGTSNEQNLDYNLGIFQNWLQHHQSFDDYQTLLAPELRNVAVSMMRNEQTQSRQFLLGLAEPLTGEFRDQLARHLDLRLQERGFGRRNTEIFDMHPHIQTRFKEEIEHFEERLTKDCEDQKGNPAELVNGFIRMLARRYAQSLNFGVETNEFAEAAQSYIDKFQDFEQALNERGYNGLREHLESQMELSGTHREWLKVLQMHQVLTGKDSWLAHYRELRNRPFAGLSPEEKAALQTYEARFDHLLRDSENQLRGWWRQPQESLGNKRGCDVYVDRIAVAGVWAGDTELAALGDCFGINISMKRGAGQHRFTYPVYNDPNNHLSMTLVNESAFHWNYLRQGQEQ